LSLARGIDTEKYTISACFLDTAGPLVQQLQAAGIETRVVPWRHPHRDPIGLLGLWRVVRNEHFDIVHVHWGGPGVRRVASRSGKSKVLFHLHGRVNEHHGSVPILVSTKHADFVVAVSLSAAAASTHPRTKAIYTGVEISEIATTPDGMTIGTAGRLLPIKGIIYLIRAMSILHSEFPQLRLEIAGSGSDHPNLLKEVTALGLEGSVTFSGWLTDMKPAFSSWQIFIQPSLEEGLPVAVLEAMAAGLPVIASDVGGIPEVVENGVTGKLVPPADPTALADCLRQMLLQPEATRKLGKAGALRVCQHFSSQRMVNEITQIYDELLNAPEASHDRINKKQPATLAK
jgi:glycosyltransferase involved in cell wall biosynthesis